MTNYQTLIIITNFTLMFSISIILYHLDHIMLLLIFPPPYLFWNLYYFLIAPFSNLILIKFDFINFHNYFMNFTLNLDFYNFIINFNLSN